jgi:hypothetical protein
MKYIWVLILWVGFSTCAFCQKKNRDDFHVRKYTENVFRITEVLFHDVVNPPAAARFYAYATLSANQVVSAVAQDGSFIAKPKFSPVLIDQPPAEIEVHFATTYTLLETAKRIIPSGYSLDEQQRQLYLEYQQWGVKKNVLDASVSFAEGVSKVFADHARSDGYMKLSTYPRYKPLEADSTWYPTPPEYMAAVEPYWNTIRTFFIDSATQFKPLPPVKFDQTKGCDFYALMNEVYTTSGQITPEQKLTANYWDCNPFANFYSGHVNIAIKKISPGGHWMNITGIVCRKSRASFAKTVFVHSLVAMGLHDGFVSCWTEKYQSHRLRPKTAINRYIDEKWNPLLETPPFPEYTSGHSVISAISATILTHFFGDDFEFTDTTEVLFGMEPRTFTSFKAAAHEAALSRFYGGIHYKDAIENGLIQGEQIGGFIIEKVSKGISLSGK